LIIFQWGIWIRQSSTFSSKTHAWLSSNEEFEFLAVTDSTMAHALALIIFQWGIWINTPFKFLTISSFAWLSSNEEFEFLRVYVPADADRILIIFQWGIWIQPPCQGFAKYNQLDYLPMRNLNSGAGDIDGLSTSAWLSSNEEFEWNFRWNSYKTWRTWLSSNEEFEFADVIDVEPMSALDYLPMRNLNW